MRKLFTVKPGKMSSLFLLLGIVALQWSFTSAATGENRTAFLLTDTSTTPVPGTAVAIPKKPASTRTNRTTTSPKPALAANLERESISFGSPTDGPNTESGIPKVNARKTTVLGSAKTTDVKTADAKAAEIKTTDAKTSGAKNAEVKASENKAAGTKNTEVKTPDTKTAGPKNAEEKAPETKASGAKNTEVKTPDAKATDAKNNTKSAGTASPKSNGTVNPKNESTPNKKVAPVEDQHVDEMISNITRTVSNEIVDPKTTGTVAIRKVEAVSTSIKSTTTAKSAAKTAGTINTKRAGATDTKNADTKSTTPVGAKTSVTAAGAKTTSAIGILSNKLTVYDSLHLKQAGLSKKVFSMALTGMSKLVTGRHIKDNLLAIVDFSQPSNKKRLYVIDLNNYQLLYNTYVAHGMKSGRAMAQSFSNKPESSKSSLGFYVTGSAYQGTNGYSLRLTGVEKGINDHAMDRGIVIHGADYVCEGLIESQGFIGRSFGCPAVAQEVSQELIDLLKDGSCLFIYHSSTVYQTKSLMLR